MDHHCLRTFLVGDTAGVERPATELVVEAERQADQSSGFPDPPPPPIAANPTPGRPLRGLGSTIGSPLHHLAEMVRNIPTRGEANEASAQAATELEAQAGVVDGRSGRTRDRVARRLRLPAHLRGLGADHRSLHLARAAQVAAVAPHRSARCRTARSLPAGPPRKQAVGVLVGHTHFDHAVDAPAIARRDGCNSYGSESLLRLMALHGLAEQTVVVEPYATYELGPFEVSFTPSRHSKLILGARVPFDGELTCDHLDGLTPGAYRAARSGESRSGSRARRSTTRAAPTCSTTRCGRRRRRRHLPRRGGGPQLHRPLLGEDPAELDPELIVPTHYDDFFVPLGEGRSRSPTSAWPSSRVRSAPSAATPGSPHCPGSAATAAADRRAGIGASARIYGAMVTFSQGGNLGVGLSRSRPFCPVRRRDALSFLAPTPLPAGCSSSTNSIAPISLSRQQMRAAISPRCRCRSRTRAPTAQVARRSRTRAPPPQQAQHRPASPTSSKVASRPTSPPPGRPTGPAPRHPASASSSRDALKKPAVFPQLDQRQALRRDPRRRLLHLLGERRPLQAPQRAVHGRPLRPRSRRQLCELADLHPGLRQRQGPVRRLEREEGRLVQKAGPGRKHQLRLRGGRHGPQQRRTFRSRTRRLDRLRLQRAAGAVGATRLSAIRSTSSNTEYMWQCQDRFGGRDPGYRRPGPRADRDRLRHEERRQRRRLGDQRRTASSTRSPASATAGLTNHLYGPRFDKKADRMRKAAGRVKFRHQTASGIQAGIPAADLCTFPARAAPATQQGSPTKQGETS